MTKKRNLEITLRNAWDRKFGDDFRADQREVKVLTSSAGQRLCQVAYSRKLEEWYLSPAGKARYEKAKCFFCEGHDEYKNLLTIARFDHFGIYHNIKFVGKCHFLVAPFSEHREYPNKSDITVLRKLALSSDLSILGNFRNSGASYPQHIHYQSLEAVFPIIERPVENVFSTDSVSVARINYPILAFSLSSVSKGGIESIAQTISVLQCPINLLFHAGTVFLVPRTKSIPSNTQGFKFAAAEVFGLVFTRTREMYNSLDHGMMLTALLDVCLPSHSRAAESFQEALIENLGNH